MGKHGGAPVAAAQGAAAEEDIALFSPGAGKDGLSHFAEEGVHGIVEYLAHLLLVAGGKARRLGADTVTGLHAETTGLFQFHVSSPL